MVRHTRREILQKIEKVYAMTHDVQAELKDINDFLGDIRQIIYNSASETFVLKEPRWRQMARRRANTAP